MTYRHVIACVKIRIYTIFRYKLNNAHFDLFLAETFEIQPLSSSEGSSQNSPVRTGVKRRHKEYENTSMLDVTLPKKKRQQPISGFLNTSSPSMTSTSGSIVGIDGLSQLLMQQLKCTALVLQSIVPSATQLFHLIVSVS